MALGRRSKAQTLRDRARATGAAAGDLATATRELTKATGEAVGETARTARDRAVGAARDPLGALEGGRKRALAVAGAATGAAGAFAFWRSRKDDRPPTHTDPARPAASAGAASAARSEGVATPGPGATNSERAASAGKPG